MNMATKKKQTELPGMEAPKHPELDTAIETYAEKRDIRVAALVEEKQAKAVLLQLAEQLGVKVYRDETASPPLVLTLTEREVSVKVTAAPGFADDGDDDADGEGLDA
jgi:hypothetical protein